MMTHVPAQLVRCVNSSHRLLNGIRLPPLLLLLGTLRGVAAGLRGLQKVLEMPVGVNGESGVIALFDYRDDGVRAKMCNKGL